MNGLLAPDAPWRLLQPRAAALGCLDPGFTPVPPPEASAPEPATAVVHVGFGDLGLWQRTKNKPPP